MGASTWPVTNRAASEERYQIASATSSGVPMAPRGVSSARAAQGFPVQMGVHFRGNNPGRHAVHRDAEGPSSLAKALVRPITAAFAAE